MTEGHQPEDVRSSRLNHGWRIVATGLSFFAFGVGGVLLWALAFPMLALMVRKPARRQTLSRRLVQRSFAFHIELMRVLGVLSYEVRGRERLQRDGLLILANHPTLIDVVFLISLLPNADCVVKSSLARNPFTRGPVRAAGYVCNDDGAGLVEDCIAAVRRGGNLIIFPEGTRSRRDARRKTHAKHGVLPAPLGLAVLQLAAVTKRRGLRCSSSAVAGVVGSWAAVFIGCVHMGRGNRALYRPCKRNPPRWRLPYFTSSNTYSC